MTGLALRRNGNRAFPFAEWGLDNFFDPFEGVAQQKGFVPSVDVNEDEDSFTFSFDLPGVKTEDLEIEAHGHTITVSGQRKWESENKDQKTHRREKFYGEFRRSFELPFALDNANVDAKHENGELLLTISKPEKTKPRRVQIKAG